MHPKCICELRILIRHNHSWQPVVPPPTFENWLCALQRGCGFTIGTIYANLANRTTITKRALYRCGSGKFVMKSMHIQCTSSSVEYSTSKSSSLSMINMNHPMNHAHPWPPMNKNIAAMPTQNPWAGEFSYMNVERRTEIGERKI
jgi:hypothetical protein